MLLLQACWHAALPVPCKPPFLAACFRSWKVTHQYLSAALGFYYMYYAKPGQLLSFSVFREDFTNSVLGFVEFLRQRQVDGKVIARHVLAIEKVLRWLRASATPAYSALQERQHDEQCTSTQRLKYQLGMTSNPQPIDPVELRKQGRWLNAPELLAVVERTCQAAIDLVKVTVPLPVAPAWLPPCLTCKQYLGMCRSWLSK